MNQTDDTNVCAHERCTCTLSSGEGVMIDGQLYCSSECARGIGCNHNGCNCTDSR